MLAPALIGRNPLHTEALWQAMFAIGAFHTEGYQTQAVAGVDIALWDLKGKALGQPISVLLGGPLRESLWVYASPVTLCDPDTAQERAREFMAKGFTAVKVKVGGELADDVERVAAVREVIGPSMPLCSTSTRRSTRGAPSPWPGPSSRTTATGWRSRSRPRTWPAWPTSAARSTSRSRRASKAPASTPFATT